MKKLSKILGLGLMLLSAMLIIACGGGGGGYQASLISGGGTHTCAITSSGSVKCWGYNFFGQLGDGTTADSKVPVSVSDLSSGASAISAGCYHTCAITSSGGAKCWGYNNYGQLGNNSNADSNVPVSVSGLDSGVRAISAGHFYTCAITSSGAVKCWGRNRDGQLGDGTTADSNIPVSVSGLSSGVSAVSAGYSHTCAITSSGAVKCWGHNSVGQLGDGTTADSKVPVSVSGLSSGVSAISAGDLHTCALTNSGGVKCWGYNFFGQLGDGTTADSKVPVSVSDLSSGVSAISAAGYEGGSHTCALTSSGGVKCWGRNRDGQLGNNSNTDSKVPVDVVGLSSGMSAIDAGYFHNCAITSSGGIKCWGGNWDGQLGDGTTVDRKVPVDVIGFGP